MRLLLALALATLNLPARADTAATALHGPLRVERIADDLDTPWSLGFLPDGGFLVTERDGRLWRFDAERRRHAVAGVPEVAARGQGGLFDIVPAADFATSRTVYLTYAEPRDGGAATTLARATLTPPGDALTDLTVIFRQARPSRAGQHFGGRIVEHPDGTLFLTLGDRGDADLAQDPGAHHGKVIRVNPDGSFPADNPAWGLPGTWSPGHRNPQGAALDPATGDLWTTAHGAQGGDEVNLVRAGLNYGWPIITYGRSYGGTRIGIGTARAGLEQPNHYWDPSIAPSGLVVYSGKLWPEWKGDLFTGSLKFDLISRLDRDGERITGEERLLTGTYARIRDIREGPDGALWFLSEGDGALYRITPAP